MYTYISPRGKMYVYKYIYIYIICTHVVCMCIYRERYTYIHTCIYTEKCTNTHILIQTYTHIPEFLSGLYSMGSIE